MKGGKKKLGIEIAPAILVHTEDELIADIEKVKDHVDWIHIDVMDKKFVPNFTVDPSKVKLPSGVKYEFHLMVEDPIEWIRRLPGKGNLFHIHVETVDNWKEIVKEVKKIGGELSVALSPDTPVKKIYDCIPDCSRALVMCVVPGYSHQKYIRAMEEKIRDLREKYPKLDIEVDGGINLKTIKTASSAGANKFVSRSTIFSAPDKAKAIQELIKNANEAVGPSKLKSFDVKKLKLMANTIRQHIIRMLYEAKSGHPGGALGLVEVFTVLYFNAMKHDPTNPEWDQRDRMVLSNGHVCPVLYAALAESGYFEVDELLTLRKLGSRLQGHPHKGAVPGIENSSGPLGQGLSQAVGMAIVAKTEKKNNRIYCVVSDGEHNEGQTWEAALLASKYKLGNLTAIMDRNKIQIDGTTEEVLPLNPIKEKYEAFGWNVIEVDGHYIPGLIKAIEKSKKIIHKPTMIVANTVPGKGIPFMEYMVEWHGKPPQEEHMKDALATLEHDRKLIENEMREL